MEENKTPQHTCPNCGAATTGNYCANCGQETHLHRGNFWHMLVHFAADYFHYDNKFFKTIKYLITRPGYLAKEYMAGRRASYLNPVQLYIFVSAVFFILFFITFHISADSEDQYFKIRYTMGATHAAEHRPTNPPDTTIFDGYILGTRECVAYSDAELSKIPFAFSQEYFGVLFVNALVHYSWHKHIYSAGESINLLLNTFVHSIPKLFFVLMPWLALLLKWFFGRKTYLYVDHAVMSLHIHTFLFIIFGIALLSYYNHSVSFSSPLYVALSIALLYFLIVCHRFYQRRWIYSIAIGTLVWSLYLFSVSMLAILNLFLVMLIA